VKTIKYIQKNITASIIANGIEFYPGHNFIQVGCHLSLRSGHNEQKRTWFHKISGEGTKNISNQTVSGLIDFHSTVYPTMEVNETRYCLVTDILLNIRKSAECIRKR